MTLIDLIKVLDEDTKIRIQHYGNEVFDGEAGDALVELTHEVLQMIVDKMWLSLNYYRALVIELC